MVVPVGRHNSWRSSAPFFFLSTVVIAFFHQGDPGPHFHNCLMERVVLYDVFSRCSSMCFFFCGSIFVAHSEVFNVFMSRRTSVTFSGSMCGSVFWSFIILTAWAYPEGSLLMPACRPLMSTLHHGVCCWFSVSVVRGHAASAMKPCLLHVCDMSEANVP